MIKERMLNIINYLDKKKDSSYKEIAEEFKLKERIVRYDIDCINDSLAMQNMNIIEKGSKGILHVPDGLNLLKVINNNEFMFSPKERISVIKLLILFDISKFNITKLCKEFVISRRSIQNDIDVIQKEFEKNNISLYYDKKYELKGKDEDIYLVRKNEIKSIVKLIYFKKSITPYENYINKLINQVFMPVKVQGIFNWINNIMEKTECTMSDESFEWYVSNILTFTWYIQNSINIPICDNEQDNTTIYKIDKYEKVIGRKLTDQEKNILSGFIQSTNKNVNIDTNLELIEAEDICKILIEEMGRKLNYDFIKDKILVKGLLNHIVPLRQRIKQNSQLNESCLELIPEEYRYVCNTLNNVLEKEGLLDITENEKLYIAVYFIGSMKRNKNNDYKNVLIICGMGYGTSTMIKDTLRNEYQLYILDSIPAYKVNNYKKWSDIDIVISTVNVNLPVDKPFVQVNAIFNNDDYRKLDSLGLSRKRILADYISIQKKLDFLSEQQKEKVMDVIKQELGFREVRIPQKYYKLSDLLKKQEIECVSNISSWQQIVKESTLILEKKGWIEDSYYNSIMDGIEAGGFYSVNDGAFALIHGKENKDIKKSCMSLVISDKFIKFGNKKVKIVFCLASRDKKEHIPAIIRLMRMVKMTDFIDQINKCKDADMAFKIIQKCEMEVEKCYQ